MARKQIVCDPEKPEAREAPKPAKRNGLKKDLDGGDDYFHAWLETLEALLAER